MLPPSSARDLRERLHLTEVELNRWGDVSRKMRICFHDGVMSQFEGFEDLEELDRNEKATPTHSIFEAYGARAWVFLLVPIVVVAVAVAYSLHPKRRTVWIGSAVALAIVALLTTMTLHLLVIAFLIYGISRASKIEGPAPGSRAARLAAERADAADDPVDDDA